MIEGQIPKQLNYSNEVIQYYLEALPDYMQKKPSKDDRKTSSGKKRASRDQDSDFSENDQLTKKQNSERMAADLAEAQEEKF